MGHACLCSFGFFLLNLLRASSVINLNCYGSQPVSRENHWKCTSLTQSSIFVSAMNPFLIGDQEMELGELDKVKAWHFAMIDVLKYIRP